MRECPPRARARLELVREELDGSGSLRTLQRRSCVYIAAAGFRVVNALITINMIASDVGGFWEKLPIARMTSDYEWYMMINGFCYLCERMN